MPADVHDLSATIIPKSDQLNSEQLLGGPLIITVTDVRAGGGDDQPVSIFHDTDPARPYKPCKTMRKVLILAWGADGTKWVGKSMELYNEPSIKFGGEVVGGIRISRLSDIPKKIEVSLTATRGKKALHEIGPLKLSDALQEVLADIAAASGRESLKQARAKGEALKSPADRELAVAAYKKRVDALKEKAAGTGEPTVERGTAQIDHADQPGAGAAPTYAQLADQINRAQDRDAADLVLDASRHLPGQQQSELHAMVEAKFPGDAP